MLSLDWLQDKYITSHMQYPKENNIAFKKCLSFLDIYIDMRENTSFSMVWLKDECFLIWKCRLEKNKIYIDSFTINFHIREKENIDCLKQSHKNRSIYITQIIHMHSWITGLL